MPILKDLRKIIKVTLPSFPDSEIELYQGLLFGQLQELDKAKTDIERGLIFLRLMIKDWNFTNEKGEKLEISEKNLNALPVQDLTALFKKVTEYFDESVKKKSKNSKS